MAQITIVGLGPGERRQLTLSAWDVLAAADEVWLRTAHHPVVAHLPERLSLHSFDSLYETAETFELVYQTIVERVLELGQREQGVIYAVPGHPLVGEATVTGLLAAARQAELSVRVVDGLSFIEPALTALEMDALDGLQIVDALDVAARHHPLLLPDLPALIAQVYSRTVASELKLVLMNQYPDDHPAVLVDAAGTAAQWLRRVPLYEIDRHEVTPLTSLYLAPTPPVQSFEGFQDTIARLRAPDGCPWDRQQTHASLRPNLLEETYEVLAAIDADDVAGLREELGDLLLQIVLQTQIAIEDGEFLMGEVIADIDAKLKRRHPHVWGDVQVNDAAEVGVNWEKLKAQERVDRGRADRSPLDGVPQALPALAQAVAYLSRVKKSGTTLPDSSSAMHVIQESLAALQDDPSPEGLGELLFAVATLAQHWGLDPESALREANRAFAARYASRADEVNEQAHR